MPFANLHRSVHKIIIRAPTHPHAQLLWYAKQLPLLACVVFFLTMIPVTRSSTQLDPIPEVSSPSDLFWAKTLLHHVWFCFVPVLRYYLVCDFGQCARHFYVFYVVAEKFLVTSPAAVLFQCVFHQLPSACHSFFSEKLSDCFFVVVVFQCVSQWLMCFVGCAFLPLFPLFFKFE